MANLKKSLFEVDSGELRNLLRPLLAHAHQVQVLINSEPPNGVGGKNVLADYHLGPGVSTQWPCKRLGRSLLSFMLPGWCCLCCRPRVKVEREGNADEGRRYL